MEMGSIGKASARPVVVVAARRPAAETIKLILDSFSARYALKESLTLIHCFFRVHKSVAMIIQSTCPRLKQLVNARTRQSETR